MSNLEFIESINIITRHMSFQSMTACVSEAERHMEAALSLNPSFIFDDTKHSNQFVIDRDSGNAFEITDDGRQEIPKAWVYLHRLCKSYILMNEAYTGYQITNMDYWHRKYQSLFAERYQEVLKYAELAVSS